MWIRKQTTWVQVLVLTVTVFLGKLLDFSEPQFPHLLYTDNQASLRRKLTVKDFLGELGGVHKFAHIELRIRLAHRTLEANAGHQSYSLVLGSSCGLINVHFLYLALDVQCKSKLQWYSTQYKKGKDVAKIIFSVWWPFWALGRLLHIPIDRDNWALSLEPKWHWTKCLEAVFKSGLCHWSSLLPDPQPGLQEQWLAGIARPVQGFTGQTYVLLTKHSYSHPLSPPPGFPAS